MMPRTCSYCEAKCTRHQTSWKAFEGAWHLRVPERHLLPRFVNPNRFMNVRFNFGLVVAHSAVSIKFRADLVSSER